MRRRANGSEPLDVSNRAFEWRAEPIGQAQRDVDCHASHRHDNHPML